MLSRARLLDVLWLLSCNMLPGGPAALIGWAPTLMNASHQREHECQMHGLCCCMQVVADVVGQLSSLTSSTVSRALGTLTALAGGTTSLALDLGGAVYRVRGGAGCRQGATVVSILLRPVSASTDG